MSIPGRVLLILFVSVFFACNSGSENQHSNQLTDQNRPFSEDLNVQELMQIHVGIRKPLQLMLRDSMLFSDTPYFFTRISPVIKMADEGRFRLDTLNLLSGNDTLLHASSEFLLVSYNELLKHGFRELFGLYRSAEPDALQKYLSRKKEIYLQFVRNDSFGLSNFHRITRAMGYDVDVLKPLQLDYEQ